MSLIRITYSVGIFWERCSANVLAQPNLKHLPVPLATLHFPIGSVAEQCKAMHTHCVPSPKYPLKALEPLGGHIRCML